MSSFTTKLILEPMDDGIFWQLCEPFTYDIGELGGEDSITVPKCFKTDFASVPRIFWRIFPPWGKYGKAAVLHDYLYSTLGRPGSTAPGDLSRRECDDIFLEAMGVVGVGWLTRHTIHRAVRLGGWMAWNEHAKEKKKKEVENAGPTEPIV